MNSFEDVFNNVINYCSEVGDIGETALKLWIKTDEFNWFKPREEK